ncbi:SgcJ/EcaC family oxidoreductase [Silvimonas sp.]|uniref:SgcJ/EcaC family oxidoreductase n=1 Tax=Silvimonas sp. TaxID=2650811 RepID=UPI00284CA0A2|nr:SgcJ/EcaC family oxidoreductase [Silvimonas sp.]MDR3427340.1 SgcJ/EcaC family oxidoreductase [Silvimonas sp.]
MITKKLLASIALLGIVASPAALAHSEICRPVTTKEIASLFDRWNASLQTGDADKVVKNYARDSILLPTVSDQPRISREQKMDYFQHFLQKKPVGKIDFRKVIIGCNSAIDAGLYTFTLKDGSHVKARYTYTYVWTGKNWLISSHHSSAQPN